MYIPVKLKLVINLIKPLYGTINMIAHSIYSISDFKLNYS